LLEGSNQGAGVAEDGDGIVRSAPRVLLRLEGAVLLSLAILGYALYGSSWWLFALVLLVPDVGAFGYLAGPGIGARAYNAFHTYAGPGVLVAIGAADHSTIMLSLGLIWFAHIGMDRALGYGLKYADRFGHTHLGIIGRDRPSSA
jgi:Domain of unknown function (DUF4260)